LKEKTAQELRALEESGSDRRGVKEPGGRGKSYSGGNLDVLGMGGSAESSAIRKG